MRGTRTDVALVERGLAESREKAQRLVMAGQVYVGERRVDKPATALRPEDVAALVVRRDRHGYVGRGAEKLAPALDAAGWQLHGAWCLDVGASTGGFTELLLERGAAGVTAVDVGHHQLHERLRADPRVDQREGCNFRHWDQSREARRYDYAVMDVSFISTTLLLAPLRQALAPGGQALLLVKPQFELGRHAVPRGGVVRDPAAIAAAVAGVREAAAAHGLSTLAEFPAGVAGRRGNREVFLLLARDGTP